MSETLPITHTEDFGSAHYTYGLMTEHTLTSHTGANCTLDHFDEPLITWSNMRHESNPYLCMPYLQVTVDNILLKRFYSTSYTCINDVTFQTILTFHVCLHVYLQHIGSNRRLQALIYRCIQIFHISLVHWRLQRRAFDFVNYSPGLTYINTPVRA